MEKQNEYLGRPAEDLPAGADEMTVTAAPAKNGETRREGTLRLIRYRNGCWVAARFLDGKPKEKET